MIPPWIRWLFVIAGLYDLGIGLAFVAAGPRLFEAASVPPPNHWGYVQFGALMVSVFGLMFLAVAFNPVRNRNLIPYGLLLKASYCGVVFYYWSQTDVPLLFKPFAFIDAAMFLLFAVAYIRIQASAAR